MPRHLILLDLITRTTLGEENKSLSFSLCSLLHSPDTSSLLDPNILHSTLFSKRIWHFGSMIHSATNGLRDVRFLVINSQRFTNLWYSEVF
jgi:hypothetical protein